MLVLRIGRWPAAGRGVMRKGGKFYEDDFDDGYGDEDEEDWDEEDEEAYAPPPSSTKVSDEGE